MECFDLGKIAYEQEDFYHTIIWMNESLAQVELEGNNPTVNVMDVLDYYAFATAQVLIAPFFDQQSISILIA